MHLRFLISSSRRIVAMSKRMIPKVNVSDWAVPSVPSPASEPSLLWPSIAFGSKGPISSDAKHFPEKEYIHERRWSSDHQPMTLVAFERAVSDAKLRLLVMDPHFDEIGVDSLQFALEKIQVSDVRLLTGYVVESERIRMRMQQFINLHRNSQRVEIHWRPKLNSKSFPFLHDRFAVVDGSLWHFGATVGGGHPSLNAASGPWSAEETRALDFFDECWRRYNA